MGSRFTRLALAIALALTGCESDTAAVAERGATDDTPDEVGSQPGEALTGRVQGRVVGVDGTPLAQVDVLACTLSTCVFGESDADGLYDVGGLAMVPQKIQILGEPSGLMNTYHYQDPATANPNVLPRDVVAFETCEPESVVWMPEPKSLVAGDPTTAIIADGRLELTGDSYVLEYPIGYDDLVCAKEVAPEHLPPFDVEPWLHAEDTTLAFLVHPDIEVKTVYGYVEPEFEAALDAARIGLTVRGVDAPIGAMYGVWVADHWTGILHRQGEAVVDAAGDLVTGMDSGPRSLNWVIFIPEDPASE